MENTHLKIFFLSIFSIILLRVGYNQTYLPGETYFGSNDFIEYKAGNLPIIISAPHGGSLEPAEIPNRNCSGCVYVKDLNTEELIRQMDNAIFDLFGCHPHIIINRLHRRKLDANRAIGDAADGNALAEQAWYDFHNFIEAAQDSITVQYGKGLYLDLHGHGHEIQRLELGYRITKSELQLSNATLNQAIYVDDSSIKNLVYNNLNNLHLSDLLRGADSFGQLYEQENYPSVPSQIDPFPFDNEAYFSGGYNTERHGSEFGGSVDGIQIECNMDGLRDSHSNRDAFAKATAQVLKSYLETHYFGEDFLMGNCGLSTSVAEVENKKVFKVFPNPTTTKLNIHWNEDTSNPNSIQIFNEWGQMIWERNSFLQKPYSVNTSNFPKGFYVIRFTTSKQIFTEKFSIQ